MPGKTYYRELLVGPGTTAANQVDPGVSADENLIGHLKRLGLDAVLLLVGTVLLLAGLSDELQVGSLKVAVADGWPRWIVSALGTALLVAGAALAVRGRSMRALEAAEFVSRDEFLHTLDEVESFTSAFAGCTRIDLMLRTGANVLNRYRSALVEAAKSGTTVRILVLDPSSEAAKSVYGPGSDQYLNNARLIPPAILALERRSKGRIVVRKTSYLPPFSMFIAYKRDQPNTYARVQINFTHTAIGGDRPTIGIPVESRWFKVLEQEFKEAWKAAERTNAAGISNILDRMKLQEHSRNRMSELFKRSEQEDFPECPFDDERAMETVSFETLSTLVIPNIAPIVDGHCLVIPRRHVERIADLTRNEIADIFDTARSVSLALMKSRGATGVNWAVQDGSDAGQTVGHVHVHVIPRQPGDLDSPGEWFGELPGGKGVARAVDQPNRIRLSHRELREAGDELRAAVNEGLAETSEN